MLTGVIVAESLHDDAQLAAALDANSAWYVDFHSADVSFVVFAGKVVRGCALSPRQRRWPQASAAQRPGHRHPSASTPLA
jgi:hypothetical protein